MGGEFFQHSESLAVNMSLVGAVIFLRYLYAMGMNFNAGCKAHTGATSQCFPCISCPRELHAF